LGPVYVIRYGHHHKVFPRANRLPYSHSENHGPRDPWSRKSCDWDGSHSRCSIRGDHHRTGDGRFPCPAGRSSPDFFSPDGHIRQVHHLS
ncbi:unnamed protein product, partial [Ascophyllum nodosum]